MTSVESESAAGDGVRLRLDFGYDGTDFSGWAAQPGRRTVEGELTAALATILRYDAVRLTVAGRTDAGVHARAAVAHVDVPRTAYESLPGRSTREPGAAAVTRLRGVLPADIVVRRVAPAPDGFDARFSASYRRYSYRLTDRLWELDPLRRREVVTHPRPLCVEAMTVEAASLTGLHDFAAFCKRRAGATTVRTLQLYSWQRDADGILVATVIADAFCHSMVRSLVGAVLPVGEGRRDPGWARRVLVAGKRDSGVVVMPPHGLCLEEVGYPPDAELARRAAAARRVRTLPERTQDPG
ncbi:MAG: tRNA pseudouridine(38-40) synthase TruA [Austwickia sp.]|nr:tRNA pseudouridine(38-40) synthase TruA [Austwickia sp.]